jgi:hypothetical protein
MTQTSQLDAHYAVIQVDGVMSKVVMSFKPTAELLVAEVRERDADDNGKRRLRDLLHRYRAGVLELADTLVALRRQCGADKADVPDADDDVRAELAYIRASHDRADRAVRQSASGYRPASAALDAAADEALDTLRHGGAL